MIPQQAADIGLSAVRKIVDVWSHSKPESLVDYTRQLRVEPITLVDADCTYLDSLPEVMQSLNSIFAGYYLQAVALSCNVGDIETRRHLDRFNPARDGSKDLADFGKAALGATGNLLATESYRHELPTPARQALGLEALSDHVPVPVQNRIDERRQQMRGAGSRPVGFGDDAIHDAGQNVNLSVGKLLEVTIGDGKNSARLPVAVRLLAQVVPSASLVHIFSEGSQDTSVKERWHGWRSGRLEFIKDLLLCRDLIDERRRRLVKDKDGVYTAMTTRKNQSLLAGVLSGQPSIGMASNLVVMSDSTAEQVELQTNYQLHNFAQRQKIFDATALMIMAVIDKRWERVTFYHRGIPLPTEVSVRELKAGNKGGNGPDVSDILRAYQLGNAPSL